jgi:hypothetical protein
MGKGHYLDALDEFFITVTVISFKALDLAWEVVAYLAKAKGFWTESRSCAWRANVVI